MSKVLRVGLVTEGPTDGVVLKAIIPAMVDREVSFTTIFPETDALQGGGGADGFGWKGVLGWCRDRGEALGLSLRDVLTNIDLLVVHLDGDVATETEIDLRKPCPPAGDTADALRGLLCAKLRLPEPYQRVVLMIPMDATEAWLLPMLRDAAWEECASDPASQFKGGTPKLLEQSGKKKRRAYEDATGTMAACWSRAQRLSQFARFATDLAGAVGALEGS